MNKNNKKLIILVASPLTESIYKRIGANELACFTDVWVLDCLHLVRQNCEKLSIEKLSHENIVEVKHFDDLEKCLAELNPDFALDFIGRCEHTRKIQEVLQYNNIKYITHHLVPLPGGSQSKSKAILKLLHSPSKLFKKIFHFFKNKINRSTPLPPDIALVAGTQSINPWIASSKKIIQTASNSFFELQRAQFSNEESEIFQKYHNKKFILFIDDCLAHSFDFMLGVFKPIIKPSEYQKIICHFFDQIEKVSNLPVVIAAHPNGKNIKDYSSLFGARSIHYNETSSLSSLCTYAMTHYSSAIHYPVMLNTPILNLTFSNLIKSEQGQFPILFSNLLEVPLIDIEEINDQTLYNMIKRPINEAKYKKFLEDFIVSTDNPGKNSFENLGKYIENSDFKVGLI